MGHRWIIAVLADLRTYAELNDLARLAREIDGLARLAEEEIATAERGTPAATLGRTWGDGAGPGTILGAAGGGAGPG